MPDDVEWFSAKLEADPLPPLSPTQINALFLHYEHLKRWNPKLNLTSIKTPDEVVLRHYCESLFFGKCMPGFEHTIADIGSGAGFPGVPLAVLFPACRVTLIESHQRKAVFLRESTRHISNVSVVAARAETLIGTYELIVSRAVAPADVVTLVPKSAPRLGLLIGSSDFAALSEDPQLSWRTVVPVPWSQRQLCVFGVSRGTCPVVRS